MKKSFFVFSLFIASLAMLAGCKAKSTVTTTTPPPITTTPAPAPSSAEMADINAGQLLFTTKCDGCHKQPAVRKHDDEGWTKTMARMGPRAKISDTEVAQVLKYLHSANEK